jgi:hypothetical protein
MLLKSDFNVKTTFEASLLNKSLGLAATLVVTEPLTDVSVIFGPLCYAT